MKTYNKHPQWYNEPLRLTKNQKNNPISVFEGFFDSFHLNEVREILWYWLVEIISSRNSISNDGQARNNHIFFYEKLEELIEAACIIKGNADNYINGISADIPNDFAVDNDNILGKGKNLIEYAKENPLYVINKVFQSNHCESLCEQLQQWLNIALISNDIAAYSESESRSCLVTFHNELIVFLKALSAFNSTLNTNPERDNQKLEAINKIEDNSSIKLEFLYQQADIKSKSVDFFKKFPIKYIRRELIDWFYAGIDHKSTDGNNLSKSLLFFLWEDVSCLMEAAWTLSLLQSKNASPL